MQGPAGAYAWPYEPDARGGMRDQALFDKIDLHLIRVLHTVLSERSVSRAAVRLGMYQPDGGPGNAAFAQ
ncbi:MAG: hypothetical protein EOO24_17485, partial [Comamonadaceae bacterium]